ncbi:formate C-acetyltransferase domain protein [Enterobacter hormaechei subsp. xiangfangensis]|nr:formate C-acetyltransferase domain protein [Enterobacter hormaechei subsp. xiangfangensis]
MDQYLYPYYRRDVELDQSLDREHAIELLHSCWLKLLEVNKIRSGSHPKPCGPPIREDAPEFIKLGVERDDAYDYAAIGCIEPRGQMGLRCTGMSFINFARGAARRRGGGPVPPANLSKLSTW